MMDHEMVITQKDLETRFKGERDLVTYAPYQVGDRVVRCGHCRSIVKTDFVTEGRCPLCGTTPFLPAPVAPLQEETPVLNQRRERSTFLWMLLLSAALSFFPYCLFGGSEFAREATFKADFGVVLMCVGLTAFIVALIVYYCSSGDWEKGEGGGLVLLPAAAPYLLLAAIWAVLFLAALAIVIGVIALGIALLASFVSNL